MKAQRGRKRIAAFSLDLGARWKWDISVTLRPLTEVGVGWALQRVWTCSEKRKHPTRIRNSVRPVRSLPRHCTDYTNTVTWFFTIVYDTPPLSLSLKPNLWVCIRILRRQFSLWSFEHDKKNVNQGKSLANIQGNSRSFNKKKWRQETVQFCRARERWRLSLCTHEGIQYEWVCDSDHS